MVDGGLWPRKHRTGTQARRVHRALGVTGLRSVSRSRGGAAVQVIKARTIRGGYMRYRDRLHRIVLAAAALTAAIFATPQAVTQTAANAKACGTPAHRQ